MTDEIGINRLSRRAFLRAGLVFGLSLIHI